MRVRLNSFPAQYERAFYKVREIEIFLDKGNGLFYLTIPHRCPQLTPHGCAIYEDRPMACRVYDGRLDGSVDCKWKELEDE